MFAQMRQKGGTHITLIAEWMHYAQPMATTLFMRFVAKLIPKSGRCVCFPCTSHNQYFGRTRTGTECLFWRPPCLFHRPWQLFDNHINGSSSILPPFNDPLCLASLLIDRGRVSTGLRGSIEQLHRQGLLGLGDPWSSKMFWLLKVTEDDDPVCKGGFAEAIHTIGSLTLTQLNENCFLSDTLLTISGLPLTFGIKLLIYCLGCSKWIMDQQWIAFKLFNCPIPLDYPYLDRHMRTLLALLTLINISFIKIVYVVYYIMRHG